MAIADFLDRLGGPAGAPDDSELPEAPDDLTELLGDDEEPLAEDPKPARKRGPMRVPGSSVKASAAEKRQVKDALSLLIKAPAAMVSMRDPVCGGAASQQADDIIKALVPIVCRNATWLGWFTASNAPFLDILALITALWPVGATVYGHHWKKGPGHDHEGAGGGVGSVDLSAYSAPTF